VFFVQDAINLIVSQNVIYQLYHIVILKL